MSWFKRTKDWAAKETLTAADLDGEFDNIAEALNGAFQFGIESASADLTLKNSVQDVPGTDLSIAPTVASRLIVVASYRVFCPGSTVFEGFLQVDGSDQSGVAYLGETTTAETGAMQVYAVSLSAGAHTAKLRAKAPIVSGAPKVRATNTRLLWLLFPDPDA